MERLSIGEAALRLGVSDATVRRRIKRGELGAEKEATPQGYEWRVLLPLTAEPPPTIESRHPPSMTEAEALRGTIALLERELAQRNQEIERRGEEIERLLHLIGREQELVRDAQRALPAATTAQPATQRPADRPPQPTHRRSDQAWWSRLFGRLVGA